MTPSLTANWIWHCQESYQPYHQVILARKVFRLKSTAHGSLKITVDGSYRLLVNGHWVADGPARSWPEHFCFDELDISAFLQSGLNELTVIARHWQVGDFHNRPQQAGLLAQLDLTLPTGRTRRLISDATWRTTWLPAWAANTPKVSIQMEPQELYDARLEAWPDNIKETELSPAKVLYPAHGGPWQDLQPRDSALLARRPMALRRLVASNRVRRRADLNFCLPVVRLVHPNIVEANYHTAAAGGMVTRLDLAAPAEIVLALEGLLASIDGVSNPDGHYQLSAGTHLLCAFAWPLYNHSKERSLRLVEPPAGLRLQNPVEPDHENPWVLLKLSDFALVEDDVTWIWFKGLDGKRDANSAGYRTAITTYLAEPQRLWTENQIEKMLPAAAEMFVTDTHWCFIGREVLGDAADLVQNPQAVMFDNPALTTVLPCGDADVELIYDLGEETVGYFDLELMAPAGVALDVYAVEYIAPDGRVQHTGDNRNGLRYITRAGLNRFTSLKRRAGRYLFLTLRYPPAGDGAVAPVHFRLVRVIESTYPAEPRASFACSDARLERIWQISTRTLELCMEDTFTDCPLYEQTYWVGDARNESIFAYDTFGAVDLARRCLRLAAQSLERYPLVGGQVPSGWDMLLPAWSFLWGIAVWDSYFYTGDRAVLDEFWPAVVRNLQGAEALLTDQGLFSGPFWNMFDWSGIDDQHETVLHNSLLLVGALRAAEKCATVLNDGSRAAWLSGMRERISRALNSWWNPDLASYPDSLLEDGSPSPSTCQHTSFLALLYDVIPTEYRAAALANTLTPPVSMVKVGSPFAMMYLYEAMEKAGQPQSILDSIYENYLPMLRAGASTVWEVFPASNARPQDFPTRSHCHAWSSAPLHFLPAVVLGIRQTAPGCAAYNLSPWLADGLDWAEGSVCTPNGMLQVSWKRTREHLQVQFSAPESAQVHFERNASMEGLEIEVKHLIPGN